MGHRVYLNFWKECKPAKFQSDAIIEFPNKCWFDLFYTGQTNQTQMSVLLMFFSLYFYLPFKMNKI